MAIILRVPFIKDGTPTTFVKNLLWEPIDHVQSQLSSSIISLEKYIKAIFPFGNISDIYLTTDSAFIQNNLITLYVKVCVTEKIGVRKTQKTLISLKNICLRVSPLAFYRFAETDVVDIIHSGNHYYCSEIKAYARENAVFGLSYYKGIDYTHKLLKLYDLLCSGQQLMFKYEIKDSSCRFFEPYIENVKDCILDELGGIFVDFNGIGKLKPVNVPFIGKQFKLVGSRYYTKYMRLRRLHCILYAEENNRNDNSAVKVLRWFPGMKNRLPISDCFFALGYISRQENESLHKFMVEKNNRILFGHIENEVITIDAGIKNFHDTGFSFPINLIKNV